MKLLQLNTAEGLDLRQREILLGWSMVIPSVLIILSLILYPIMYNIYLSFFDVQPLAANTYIGLENHKNVVLDPGFWNALVTTIIYVVFTTLGTTMMCLFVALVMNQEFPLRSLARSLILFPYFAPVISVVFSWQFIFDPDNGIFMDITYVKLPLLVPNDFIATSSNRSQSI